MNRLSTDQIPRQQRLPFLHDFVGRQVARWQFKPLSDELSLDVAAFALADDVTVGKVKYSPIAGARTRELIADGRKNYILTIHDADHEIDVEDGPPILIKAGDMLLVNEGTRSRFRLPSVRANLVSLGHARLMDRLPGLGSQSHYHVPAATPGVDMVRDYADLLYRNSCAASGASAITSGHFYDLVAHSLAGQVKSDGDRTRQGVGAARLALAKREALKQLHDPALGITAVARSQGVTPRYLQRLFEERGGASPSSSARRGSTSPSRVSATPPSLRSAFRPLPSIAAFPISPISTDRFADASGRRPPMCGPLRC